MKVTIVTLNYNGLEDTRKCLESLKKLKKDNHEVEILVVDNNSSDGSKLALSKVKGIKFIQNERNLGFSKGNNKGIKQALGKGSDYILILNNDTLVDKNFLLKLLRNREADIVAPKIYFEKGFEFHKKRYKEDELGKVVWYAGGEIDWENILGKHLGVDEVDRGQFNRKKEINFATGACMLVKKEVFEKIGFFDEKYFLYFEDMDFCIRAKIADFKIMFDPEAIIWHKNASSTGGSGSKLQDYHFTKSRLLFTIKFAKLRTKIAVFKEIISQTNNPMKRRALIEFLTLNFG